MCEEGEKGRKMAKSLEKMPEIEEKSQKIPPS